MTRRPSGRLAPAGTLVVTARNVDEIARAWCDGELTAEQTAEIERQLAAQPPLSAAFERRRKVLSVLAGNVGGISPDFDERASRRLAHRNQIRATRVTQGLETSSAQLSAMDLGVEDENLVPERQESGLDRLTASLGAAPWWFVSGAFHALLILLLFLIGMMVMKVKDQNTVIVTSLEKKKEPEKEKEPLPRDLFKTPQPLVETAVPTEQPVVVMHEEVEVADHNETADEMDNSDVRGEEGISDIPLGGSGFSGAIGVGGGGAGAFGRPLGGGRQRLQRAEAGGGGKATESAVDKALEWLARNQEADGRWDGVKHGASGPCDPAVTGLALLAFLGAGHTEKVGKYKDNVSRGIKWLIGQQREDGRIPATQIGHLGYNHAIAGMALAEASAMGRVAETKAAAQKAIDYTTEIHQHGDGSEKRGWRYNAKSSEDISVSGWFIMQIKSGKVAGLHVNPASFEGASKFLDTVEVEKAKPGDPYSGHRYGYQAGTVKDPACNGAIGCLGRQFLGVPPEQLQGGVEYFLEKGGVPQWKYQHFYYWYYATLCCFQQGGEVWNKWNDAMKPCLLDNQIKDGGPNDGSWEPSGKWVSQKRGGGRVMSTALGAMCLEVYYRYLPMYR